MKVLLLSDLHTEWGNVPIYPEGVNWDVVVLAGDIGGHRAVVPWCIETFGDEKPIVFVPGNHEFYGDTFEKAQSVMEAYSSAWDNLNYLDNDSVMINGVEFIGSTLWGGFKTTHTEFPDKQVMLSYDTSCNDSVKITKWNSVEAYLKHKENLDFLLTEISAGRKNKKRVIVTHHAPDPLCSNPIYKDNILASTFHSNVYKELQEKFKKKGFNSLTELGVQHWMHGHVHYTHQTEIDGVKFWCNARGYPHKEIIAGFTSNMIIEV